MFAPVAGAPVGRPDDGADAHVAAAAVGSARIHRADASNQLACDTSDASDARTREDQSMASRRASSSPTTPARAPAPVPVGAVDLAYTSVVASSSSPSSPSSSSIPCTDPAPPTLCTPCCFCVFFCLGFPRGCDGGAPIDHRVADDFAARGGGGAREFVRR